MLLRGVSDNMVEKLKATGDLTGLASASGRSVEGRFIRCWRAEGEAGKWNVVVEVKPGGRGNIIRAAKQVRASTGVVVAPYLIAFGCAVRKERLEVFDNLRKKDLKPRWCRGRE